MKGCLSRILKDPYIKEHFEKGIDYVFILPEEKTADGSRVVESAGLRKEEDGWFENASYLAVYDSEKNRYLMTRDAFLRDYIRQKFQSDKTPMWVPLSARDEALKSVPKQKALEFQYHTTRMYSGGASLEELRKQKDYQKSRSNLIKKIGGSIPESVVPHSDLLKDIMLKFKEGEDYCFIVNGEPFKGADGKRYNYEFPDVKEKGIKDVAYGYNAGALVVYEPGQDVMLYTKSQRVIDYVSRKFKDKDCNLWVPQTPLRDDVRSAVQLQERKNKLSMMTLLRQRSR